VTIKKNPGLEEKLAIARLKQGDLNGMEALVRLYQVRAVSAAFLVVRDPKLAEDIVHDAFLRAAEKINQFDESRPFGAWFLRSVVNAAIKAAKRQKRFIPLDGPQVEDVSSVAVWLMDPHPNPESVVETQETRQMVWKALGELPPEQRAAIVMRHFLEMSEVEMTQELDRPLTTIRWRLKTARNRLRKLLELFWKTENPSLEDEIQG
jgi:RNA polymerase sigma-70 factor, ECF subfamily